VSSDQDQASFDEYYAEMPWLCLDFSARDQKAAVSDKFGIAGIPSLVLLDGDSGDIITEDGRSAIMECDVDKLRTYAADKLAAAAALDEKMKIAPAEVKHPDHASTLRKTTSDELGGPYRGGFGCDVCGQYFSGWMYHSDENWDLCPKCAGVLD